MKKASLIYLAALLSSVSFAQNIFVPGKPGFICSYYGEPVNLPLRIVNSSENAKQAITAIMDVVGLGSNFEIKQSNIPNAAAVNYNNKRYIFYNPTFINQINNESGDKWAAIAILAHEIGHHLDGHTLSGSGSHPETELKADEFSGFVLRKMGATLLQSQSAMQLLANPRATGTHPAKGQRLVSIDNGWSKADAQINGRAYTAKTIVPAQPKNTAEMPTTSRVATLNKAYINFNVIFSGDRNNKYFITSNNNLVTLRNSQLLILGTMVKAKYEDYPYAIRMEGSDDIFISRSGNIVNKTGKNIGYLKS